MSSEAYVTLATTDDYALGALVLAQSIRQTGTTRDLVVLITNQLSDLIRETLESHFDEVVVVEELNSNDDEHLQLLSRPELGITFTKINCWLLEEYSKCVFLDSDTLVLRNIDDLFQREEFSAAADAGWPDCFNSGVFVYQPSKETFRQLVSFASQQNSSFDGGDQGLLNRFFSDWRSGDISRHLPFTYNVTSNAFYSYLPAVTRFRNDIHIVHFAGSLKPWQLTYNPQNQQLSGNLSGQSDVQRDFLLSWWTLMYQQIWPQLSKTSQTYDSNKQSSLLGGGSFAGGYVSSVNYGNGSDNPGVEVGSVAHRRAWEAGYVDYSGRDSFTHIQEQLERNFAQQPQVYHPSQQRQTPSPPSQTTSILKRTTPSPPHLSQPIVDATTTFVRQTVVTQTTAHLPSTAEAQSTTYLPPPVVTQTTTRLPSTVVIQAATHSSHPIVQETKTYLPPPVTTHFSPPVVTQTTTPLSSTSVKESLLTGSFPQNLSREPTVSLAQTTSLLTHPTTTASSVLNQSSTGSTLLNDSVSSTTDHESNWKVKSTIVTAYTQGAGISAGPTVVSKVVSETVASSDSDVATVTTIKQNTDSISLPGSHLIAKTSNDHVAWLFDKIFIALTYMISFCYLLFLLALRRSKDNSIIHGSDKSVRGVSQTTTFNNSGNTLKK